jgi:hypothetical protein
VFETQLFAALPLMSKRITISVTCRWCTAVLQIEWCCAAADCITDMLVLIKPVCMHVIHIHASFYLLFLYAYVSTVYYADFITEHKYIADIRCLTPLHAVNSRPACWGSSSSMVADRHSNHLQDCAGLSTQHAAAAAAAAVTTCLAFAYTCMLLQLPSFS